MTFFFLEMLVQSMDITIIFISFKMIMTKPKIKSK